MCFLLPPAPQPAELLNYLNYYILSGKLDWSFYVHICMDRAVVMAGQLSGFTVQLKEVTFKCETVYDIIVRKILLAKNCHLNLVTFFKM